MYLYCCTVCTCRDWWWHCEGRGCSPTPVPWLPSPPTHPGLGQGYKHLSSWWSLHVWCVCVTAINGSLQVLTGPQGLGRWWHGHLSVRKDTHGCVITCVTVCSMSHHVRLGLGCQCLQQWPLTDHSLTRGVNCVLPGTRSHHTDHNWPVPVGREGVLGLMLSDKVRQEPAHSQTGESVYVKAYNQSTEAHRGWNVHIVWYIHGKT